MSKELTVVAISDLHGHLPAKMPPADILAIGGDVCPGGGEYAQSRWLETEFFPWLWRQPQPASHKILVSGNHDWPFFAGRYPSNELCRYLQDSGTVCDGVNVYGSPWQPRFHDWAFNADEEFLEQQWNKIPEGTDLLVLHGPPRGYGDLAPRRRGDEEKWPDGEHTGSPSLLKRIREIRPQLVIYGHIHEGRGVYDCDGITLANVAMVDGRYRPVHSPTILSVSIPCKLSA